jgi:hypothetical protein
MRPLARKALEGIKARGGRVIDHDSIDRTLQEINGAWQPGTLKWMKINRPESWKTVIRLEREINEAALSRNMISLETALNRYRELMTEAVKMCPKPPVGG